MSSPNVYTKAGAEEVARLAKERRDKDLDDVRFVISTKSGRRFAWRLLSDAHVFQSTFVPGTPDLTSFREGERNVGLVLLRDIEEARLDAFFEMMREAAIEREELTVKERENERNRDSTEFYNADERGSNDSGSDD